MKRFFLLLLIFICCISFLSASPEFWIGIGLTSGSDYVSEGLRTSLKANSQLMENGLYMDGNLKSLNLMGPFYEVAFFPYGPVKIGLYVSGSTSFTIGIDNGLYRSINWDFRQNARAGIAYNQFFGGDIGFFVDCAFDYAWYNIAGDNQKNSKLPVAYSLYEEMGIYTDTGFIVKNDSNYFKFGFAFRKPLQGKLADGWALDIFLGGGLYF